MTLRVHKVALAPNNKQDTALREHCRYATFARNFAVRVFYEGLDDGVWLSYMDIKVQFNVEKKDSSFEWTRELSQNASKNAIHDFGSAVSRWKGRNAVPGAGKPKYRRWDSLRYQADNGRNTCKVSRDKHSLRLPKIGYVRMRESLRFYGETGRVHISHDGKRWYASVGVHTDEAPAEKREGDSVGIDVGVTYLATLSDGSRVENPRSYEKAQRKRRRLHKAVARSVKVHGKAQKSNRRKRTERRLRRVEARVANVRQDVQHKATTRIVKSYAIIGVETLNVQGMKKNRRLSKAVSDAAMSSFLQKIDYKAEMYGSRVHKVDRWYPSTKTCSACQAVKRSMLLAERLYVCFECGADEPLDRDINAATNIEREAQSFYDSKNGHVGCVRPRFSSAALAVEVSTKQAVVRLS